MPFLREGPRHEVKDERIIGYFDRLFGPDRGPVTESGAATGTPGYWCTVYALSPALFRHATDGFTLYRDSDLEPLIRELGQIRAGYARQSRLCSRSTASSCATSTCRRRRSPPSHTSRAAHYSISAHGWCSRTQTHSSSRVDGSRTSSWRSSRSTSRTMIF